MKYDDYAGHDALGLAALVATREASPAELLDAALARQAAVNPSINAVVRDLAESARREVRATPPAVPGPFHGVPFLLKDLFQDLRGVPSSCGSRALAQVPAPEDSDVVRLWQRAGLVIFGKTNTPEFGAKNVTEPEVFGPTRNPWDLTRTPGGSSGGSAAAVAAGIVPVAGASDGGGSIRIPAANCGLFGLKPGRGRISMGPSVGEGMFGAAVQGVISRSVRDSAAMLDLLMATDPHAPYAFARPQRPLLEEVGQPTGRMRIGYCVESPLGTPVDAQAVAAVEDAARLLESLGHHVEAAAPRLDGMQLCKDFLQTWFCQQAALVDHLRANGAGHARRDFEFDTRIMAAVGRGTPGPQVIACEANWQVYRRALAAFHGSYDLWLTPVLAAPPLRIGANATPRFMRLAGEILMALGGARLLQASGFMEELIRKNLGWTPFTQLANLTGRPAMSVPLYWTPDGLPLGVQFVGPVDGEAALVRLASQLEQARPWFRKRPDEARLLAPQPAR
ncbi:MAG: amidase [Aquabacterium sp.]|nr:MAG: amidase [Aquabacterium sp.]